MGHSGDLPGRMSIPLAFLYTRHREPISGATRFQKLVFLAQQESDLPTEYDYEAGKYGPYSKQLQADIYELADAGYVEKVEVENSVGNTRHDFKLTTDGIEEAKRFARRDKTGRIFDSVQTVKREWGKTRLDELIQYVYNKYEDYTTSTELNLDQLFDPEAESPFLENGEDEEDEYAGPGPGEWQDVNPSAEELFSTE